MSFLQRSTPSTNGSAAGVVPPDGWSRTLPALSEYLFSEVYPDGTRRQRATLTVMAGDARGVKVVLNDREEGRSLWATGDDLDGALEALEIMLQQPVTPWRMDKQVYRSPVKKS